MWQRFTEETRQVIFFAQEEAARLGRNDVGTEHILLGILRRNDTSAIRVLKNIGASPDAIRRSELLRLPSGTARSGQEMQLTAPAKRVLDFAYDEARMMNSNNIGTEHILLGLIREQEGLGGKVLREHGISLELARRTVQELQENNPHSRPMVDVIHLRVDGGVQVVSVKNITQAVLTLENGEVVTGVPFLVGQATDLDA